MMELITEIQGDVWSLDLSDPRAILLQVLWYNDGLECESCERCGVPFKFFVKVHGRKRSFTFKHCNREENPNLGRLNTIMVTTRSCPFYCPDSFDSPKEHAQHFVHYHLRGERNCMMAFLISEQMLVAYTDDLGYQGILNKNELLKTNYQ